MTSLGEDACREAQRDAAVVVAHPDDEILWFSSLVETARTVIVAFLDYPPSPSLGAARRSVIAEYPLANIDWLRIDEAQSFDKADWKRPAQSPFGLQLVRDPAAERRYQQTFHSVVHALRFRLGGFRNVFTHNPWGEYGHEDHVLIYEAVRQLQPELGFRHWFSNYCGTRSVPLMLHHLQTSAMSGIELTADLELAGRIAGIYKKHGCWTWYDDYAWFRQECMLTLETQAPRRECMQRSIPLNLVRTTFETDGLRKSSLGQRTRRFLKKALVGGLERKSPPRPAPDT